MTKRELKAERRLDRHIYWKEVTSHRIAVTVLVLFLGFSLLITGVNIFSSNKADGVKLDLEKMVLGVYKIKRTLEK